jgi:hypothetical protein
MKRKTLILTVITAGLVIAATSAALSLYPKARFTSDQWGPKFAALAQSQLIKIFENYSELVL